ncbi:thiamine phosphate synthase [Clostridium sp. CTA-19]
MIYLITNRQLVQSDEEYFQKIEAAVKYGICRIILREKNVSDDVLLKYAKAITKIIENTNCKLIINSNEFVYKKVKPYGIHLPFEMFLGYEKNKDEIVGVSIHSLEEAIKADKLGATYILASNIYETKCKEGLKGKGVKFIEEIKKHVSCKVIALGGIKQDNMKEVYNSGADGVAMMSAFMK